jgi:hypothetical protein
LMFCDAYFRITDGFAACSGANDDLHPKTWKAM